MVKIYLSPRINLNYLAPDDNTVNVTRLEILPILIENTCLVNLGLKRGQLGTNSNKRFSSGFEYYDPSLITYQKS